MADQNPEVKVKLTAEDTGVAAAIRQLGQELKNLKQTQREVAEGAISLRKAFELFAVVREALKLRELGKEAADSAINIGKMADKTGISTETLSVFHKVAGDMAVSVEAVDKGLLKGAGTIADFEQGSSKAAKAFAILNLTQKDFAGLKPDEKIKLVTERLGGLEKGFEKANAQRAIFGKGTGDLAIVMNSLAAQGFDKATEATRKLGLLLSQETTDAFRVSKAAMQELHDASVGMATQFEAGLLPALTDVTEGFVETITGTDQGVESFKYLGEIAGTALRYIAFSLQSVGIEAGHVFNEMEEAADFAFNHTREAARTAYAAIAGFIRSGVGGAAADAATQLATTGDKNTQDFAARLAAIEDDNIKAQQALYDNLFPSPEEEARRNKERIGRLRPDKTTEPGGVGDDSKARDAARDDLRRQAEEDRIAKAEAALLVKQLENEISIWKAYEKQRETIEKNSYEDGRLTTLEYYRRRQVDLKAETDKEVEILQAELKAAEDEVTRSAQLRDSNTAKSGQFKGRAQREGVTTEGGKQAAAIANDYSAAAAKNEADRLAALGRFNELQAKINTTRIDGQTKSIALDTDRDKEQETDRKKVLEFEAQLAELQGKRIEQSLAQIEAEAAEKRKELEKAGVPTDQIDQEIAKWKELTVAVTEFESAEDQVEQKEKTFQIDRNSFDIARAQIEAQQRAGLISKSAAEKKINDLIDERLPLLRQEAQAELAAAQAALERAKATGNLNDIAKAQQQISAAQNLAAEVDKIGIKTNQLATNVKGALTQDFNTFFNSIITGTKTVGQAFAQLGINIVQSLEQVVAQMLVTIAIEKIFSALGLGPKTANTEKQKEVTAANTAEATSAVFVQAIEAIPFPANLAAAPALAALAEAEMGTLVAGAQVIGGQAARGAYLPKDMVLQAHAQEMVLPEYLSTGLDYAIKTGSFRQPSALSQPVVNSRNRTYNDNSTNNFYHHGEDAVQVLDREFIPRLKKARRDGHARP